MINLKFSVGDVLHLQDIEDINYNKNSLYEVITIITEGYVLRSLRNENLIFPDDLIRQKLDNDPITWVESNYRLATEKEILLGPQNL